MFKLARYLKPYLLPLLLVAILVFGQAMVDLTLPDYMSDIVDVGIVEGKIAYILQVGLKMLAIALVGAVCAIGISFLSSKAGAGFARDLRAKVFAKVEQFSLEEFNNFSTASLITRTTNDIQQVQQVIVMMLRIMLMAPMIAIGGIIKVLQVQPDMSYILIAALPFIGIIVGSLAYFGIPRFKIVQKLTDKLNLISREDISGIRVIRAFSREQYQEEKFDQTNLEVKKLNILLNRVMGLMNPAMMLILNFTMIAVIWVGANRIGQGTLAVGNMMAFIQYAMQIIMAFLMLSMVFIMLPRAAVSANRINEVLNCTPKITDPVTEEPMNTDLNGTIEFKNVSFKYPQAEENILTNISFTTTPGTTTAIIGGTGSGKSTLINLIPRFFDTTEGEILLNGVNIKNINQKTLREQIGYVPQQGMAFSGTIAENIAYGQENMTQAEINQACEIAQATQFIAEKEEGFNARVAQGGTNLSGGQRQRLSIARALAKNPPIFIFDDSFSALDFKTDSLLRKALKTNLAHATLIIVAQRISTIMDAEQIILLDNGQIAAHGNHQQLMASSAIYREIALSQLSQEELA